MLYSAGPTRFGNTGQSTLSQADADFQALRMDAASCVNCINCTCCVMCSGCVNCINCSYCKDCKDCSRVHFSELCIECVGCEHCTQCANLSQIDGQKHKKASQSYIKRAVQAIQFAEAIA